MDLVKYFLPALLPAVAKPAKRYKRGVEHHENKLTESQVLAIRKDTRPCRAIAAEYGIAYTGVHKIRRGETWRHLP